MRVLMFAPQLNSPGLGDADEFRRELGHFADLHSIDDAPAIFDNRRDFISRRREVIKTLRAYAEWRPTSRIDTLVFACHGWPNGIQAGFRIPHIPMLVRALVPISAPALTVVLYCCSNGADDDGSDADEKRPGPGGDGGFADRLRDSLCDAGVRATVFAHSVKGHATRNPLVRVFVPDERAGGRWLVEPPGRDESPSRLWLAWKRKLHSTDLRLRFPFMSQAQLEAELSGDSGTRVA